MRKLFLFFIIISSTALIIPSLSNGWPGSCTVEITGPRFLCIGETITLEACGEPPGGSCSWSNTPGLSFSGCTANFKGLYEGEFWINVTYSSAYDFRCYDTDLITVGGRDWDGDGHYAIGSCKEPADDCNDNDPAIHPGATEVCDGKDNNCDGQIDEGLSTDADGDGHYTPESCKTPKDDCNDNDPEVYPGATELCDAIDNNCNGIIDEGYPVGDICTVGIGACERQGVYICSGDGSGVICSAIPGEPSPEICDGIDNNCNGIIDDSCQNVCPVLPLTPLTDPLAIRMESGETVIWEGVTQAMLEAVDCFKKAVYNVGGNIFINSAYRPHEYQQHLWEVWNRYRDLSDEDDPVGPECNALREDIRAEFSKHNLSLKRRPARERSAHSDGIAIDANVTLPAGQDVDTLANSCDLHRPYPSHHEHFELRR